MRRRQVLQGTLATIAASTFAVPLAAQSRAQVLDIQRVLAQLGLEPGPADGAPGPRTRTALDRFMNHRGVSFDGTITEGVWREVIGVTRINLPDTPGLQLGIVPPRLPSADSYARSTNNPRQFTLRLRRGDYDPVDYRGNRNIFSSGLGINFSKQRAELSSQQLRLGRSYTIEFEVNISNPSAGTFFQFANGDSAMVLLAYPDAIRFNAGQAAQNIALLRGDWIGSWHQFRIGFHPDSARGSWVRFFVNGTEVFDSRGRDLDLPFVNAFLKCGLYRGNIPTSAEVSFRNMSLRDGPPQDA